MGGKGASIGHRTNNNSPIQSNFGSLKPPGQTVHQIELLKKAQKEKKMKNVLKLATASAIALTTLAGSAFAGSFVSNFYDHAQGVDVVARVDTETGEVLEIISKQDRD
jgi:hypothetical protein